MKIIRWIALASTIIGVILIILASFSGLCHKCCTKVPTTTCVIQHQGSATVPVAKTDSASCKQHPVCSSAMAKTDSVGCCKHQPCCCNAYAMNANCCRMHRSLGLFQIANTFFLLTIALFFIKKLFCCGKCCETKEEKKEG